MKCAAILEAIEVWNRVHFDLRRGKGKPSRKLKKKMEIGKSNRSVRRKPCAAEVAYLLMMYLMRLVERVTEPEHCGRAMLDENNNHCYYNHLPHSCTLLIRKYQ